MLNPLNCRPENIWEYRQNKPSLIARDMEKFGVPMGVTLRVLMARGVFKWLNVRRMLIKLKNTWKDDIVFLEKKKKALKKTDYATYLELKGYVKALVKCRGEIRALCHSERWACPDFDEKSIKMIQHMLDSENFAEKVS